MRKLTARDKIIDENMILLRVAAAGLSLRRDFPVGVIIMCMTPYFNVHIAPSFFFF